MNKEIIEKYIQFAKKNLQHTIYFAIDGDNIKNIKWNGYEYMIYYEDKQEKWSIALNSMIMRKEFIEAIVKGISENRHFPIQKTFDMDYITINQALAIRDNKLEEFIKNILDLK